LQQIFLVDSGWFSCGLHRLRFNQEETDFYLDKILLRIICARVSFTERKGNMTMLSISYCYRLVRGLADAIDLIIMKMNCPRCKGKGRFILAWSYIVA